jgi:hypothetical protein
LNNILEGFVSNSAIGEKIDSKNNTISNNELEALKCNPSNGGSLSNKSKQKEHQKEL